MKCLVFSPSYHQSLYSAEFLSHFLFLFSLGQFPVPFRSVCLWWLSVALSLSSHFQWPVPISRPTDAQTSSGSNIVRTAFSCQHMDIISNTDSSGLNKKRFISDFSIIKLSPFFIKKCEVYLKVFLLFFI